MLGFEYTNTNIQVAVRLRPMIFFGKYNRQETDKGSKSLVQVEDSTTITLSNPKDSLDEKTFGFSHCYWSHDGYTELPDGLLIPDLKHPNGGKYCDQKRVFENFGREIVQNSWSGFNSTLICFGESGSGKSWSLFGQGANKGILPLVSSELFRTMRDKEKSFQLQQLGNSSVIEVKVTMMEVYEDKIRDLLAVSNSTKFKQVIKIRDHPKRGFYVEGLRSIIVSNAEDVQQRIDEGMQNRALISTNLNLICNKVTVIVGLSLLQKYRNPKGDEITMSALMDFYDLSINSESKTLETTVIADDNVSTSTSPISILEKCLKGTVVLSKSKKMDGPFKKLTMTKLLERALIGNSKTYMLAAISPSERSYQITLETLTFADKIQRQKTIPVVNEEQTNKLTRELKIENEYLKKMLSSNDFEKNEFLAWTDKVEKLPLTDKEEFKKQIVDDIKSQIKDNEKEIKNLTQSHEERLKLAKLDKSSNEMIVAAKKLENDKKYTAHLYNLNQDNQLTGWIIHLLSPGTTEFGCQKRKEPFITISGPGIRECHGSTNVIPKDNKVNIRPFAPDCLILVNGEQLLFESPLFHNDRVVLGGNQIWIFQNPRDPWADKNSSKLTYQFAQEEIALKSKFYIDLCEKGPVSLYLKNDIIEIISLIGDANGMSEDLEKGVEFNLVTVDDIDISQKLILLDSNVLDDEITQELCNVRQVMVKMEQSKDEIEYLWTKRKFLQRYDNMKSIYAQIQEDGLANTSNSADPFLEDIDTELPIGHGLVFLKPLAYLIEIQLSTDILDFVTRKPIGCVKVEFSPCNDFFEKFDDTKVFLTKSDELLGNSLHFMFKIGSIDLPSKYKDIYCKYKFNQESILSTGKLDSKSSYILGSVFKYERRVSIDIVTQKLLDYLESEFLVLSFFGKLRPKKMRNLFKSEFKYGNSSSSLSYLRDYQKQVAELAVFKKSEGRLQQKISTLRILLEQSEELAHETIPIHYIKKILDAQNQENAKEVVNECTEQLKPKEEPVPVPKLSAYQKISEVCSVM